jgi:hypothetical protein
LILFEIRDIESLDWYFMQRPASLTMTVEQFCDPRRLGVVKAAVPAFMDKVATLASEAASKSLIASEKQPKPRSQSQCQHQHKAAPAPAQTPKVHTDAPAWARHLFLRFDELQHDVSDLKEDNLKLNKRIESLEHANNTLRKQVEELEQAKAPT